MNSPAGAQVSVPTWGGRSTPVSPVPARARASSPAALRTHRKPLELRGPRAFPSEAAAGAVLVVLWVLLWAVFTEGVVTPAAALRGGPDGAPPAAAVAGAR
jgi:hypothetical protein